VAWKCPQCGVENEDGARRCEACGHIVFGKLSLTAGATGQSVSFTIDTDVGKHLLRTFVGDEAKYCSEPQFRVVKEVALGGWAIVPSPGAVNPTYLDGRPLGPTPELLSDGGVVSVGPDRVKLTIRIGS
jgi:hypothetical protein